MSEARQSSDRDLQAKSKLHEVIRVNESLKGELKRRQKRLLKIVQDKYFLCEKLLVHVELPKGPGRPPSLKRQLEMQRVKRKYRKRAKKTKDGECVRYSQPETNKPAQFKNPSMPGTSRSQSKLTSVGDDFLVGDEKEGEEFSIDC